MKYILAALLVAFSATAFAQKTVVITQYPQEVPIGKKWVLKAGQEVKVELGREALSTSSYCGQMIFTSLRTMAGIVEGEYRRMPNNIYAINFEKINKVPNASVGSYSVVPFDFIHSDNQNAMVSRKRLEEVGLKQLVFYQGQNVYVNNCLINIQMIESDLSAKELATIKQEEEAAVEAVQREQEKAKAEAIRLKEERRNEILLSEEYHSTSELANTSNIKLTVKADALNVINAFINDFKDDLEAQRANYAVGGERNQFLFYLQFDNAGNLDKVDVNLEPRNGEDNKRLVVPQKYYITLKNYISVSEGGIIEFDGDEFTVNSEFSLYFKAGAIKKRQYLQIMKSRRGEVKLLKGKALSEDEILEETEVFKRLQEKNNFEELVKGRYELIIYSTRGDLSCAHSQNYGQREEVKLKVNEVELKSIRAF